MELGIAESFRYFWPEVALAASALTVAALARLRRLDQSGLGELAILGAAVSVFLAARLAGWGEVWIFGRALVVDGFAVFFKIVIGLATVAVLWISLESAPFAAHREGDACALALVAALALDVMASAASLWVGYASVEVASLALWGLVRGVEPEGSAPRGSRAGTLVSAAMLSGVAWIAGFSGSADYERVHRALFDLLPPDPLAQLVLAAATGAVVLAFPSRVWIAAAAADAGEEPALDAFVAVGFTAAGIALTVRLLFAVLSQPGAEGHWALASGLDWRRTLAAASVAAMTIGNLGALRDRSLQGVLVATSLVHVGYVLLGLVTANDRGLEAALFYLGAFAIASLGAFHLAALITRAGGRGDLEACRGLLRGGNVLAGSAMTIFLLSLAGMPLLVGFLAKLHLFAQIFDQGLAGLVLLGSVNGLLSLFVYARIVREMRLPGAPDRPLRLSSYDACLTLALASAIIVFGLYEAPLRNLAGRSIHLLPR